MKLRTTNSKNWLVLTNESGQEKDVIVDLSNMSALIYENPTDDEREFVKQYLRYQLGLNEDDEQLKQ